MLGISASILRSWLGSSGTATEQVIAQYLHIYDSRHPEIMGGQN
jgi:hypothetical protein